MNYSWIAYENTLRELPKHIPPEYAGHEKVRHLQSELIQNIAQARRERDTPELRSRRKDCVVEMDSIMRQATKVSFIELCISTNPVLGYLIGVYRAVQDAYRVFSSQRVWPIQCRNIIEQFGKRPLIDNVVTNVSVTTQSSLRDIDERVSSFVRLIEDFEKQCSWQPHKPSESLRSKQVEIRHELKYFVVEVQKADYSSFEEFICIWQELIRAVNVTQSSTYISAQQNFQEKDTHTSSPTNNATENKNPPSNGQADVIGLEKPHQSINQKSEQKEREIPSINITTLREAMVKAFGEDDLILLCADLSQTLRNDSITYERISLDSLAGSTKPAKVQSLIDHCERRGWLTYLVKEVQKVRSNLKF